MREASRRIIFFNSRTESTGKHANKGMYTAVQLTVYNVYDMHANEMGLCMHVNASEGVQTNEENKDFPVFHIWKYYSVLQ